MTPGQRRRRERNLLIAAAWHGGASQRLICRVLGLSRTRVFKILAALAEEAAANSGRRIFGSPVYRDAFRLDYRLSKRGCPPRQD